jgi:hypothetical protein
MTNRSYLPYILTALFLALTSSIATLMVSGYGEKLLPTPVPTVTSQPYTQVVTVNLQTAIHRCRQELSLYYPTREMVSSFYDGHSSSYRADQNAYRIYMEFNMKERGKGTEEVLAQCDIAANNGNLEHFEINGKEENTAFFHMVAYSFKQIFRGDR